MGDNEFSRSGRSAFTGKVGNASDSENSEDSSSDDDDNDSRSSDSDDATEGSGQRVTWGEISFSTSSKVSETAFRDTSSMNPSINARRGSSSGGNVADVIDGLLERRDGSGSGC